MTDNPNLLTHTKRVSLLVTGTQLIVLVLGFVLALKISDFLPTPPFNIGIGIAASTIGWQVMSPLLQIALSAGARVFVPTWTVHYHPTFVTRLVTRYFA